MWEMLEADDFPVCGIRIEASGRNAHRERKVCDSSVRSTAALTVLPMTCTNMLAPFCLGSGWIPSDSNLAKGEAPAGSCNAVASRPPALHPVPGHSPAAQRHHNRDCGQGRSMGTTDVGPWVLACAYLRLSTCLAACGTRSGREQLLHAVQLFADGPRHDGGRKGVSTLLRICVLDTGTAVATAGCDHLSWILSLLVARRVGRASALARPSYIHITRAGIRC